MSGFLFNALYIYIISILYLLLQTIVPLAVKSTAAASTPVWWICSRWSRAVSPAATNARASVDQRWVQHQLHTYHITYILTVFYLLKIFNNL